MTYYADLSRCAYFDNDGGRRDLIAVGWLSSRREYSAGPVAPAVVERLFDQVAMLDGPFFARMTFKGIHDCEFCGKPVTKMADARGRIVSVGATNLCIPALESERLFVAPSLILHYIVDHGYCPPESFLAAVLACPPLTDPDYQQKVLEGWSQYLPPTAPPDDLDHESIKDWFANRASAIAVGLGLGVLLLVSLLLHRADGVNDVTKYVLLIGALTVAIGLTTLARVLPRGPH